MSSSITLPLFDDMHTHFRDGAALKRSVADTSYWCARALIMPNLVPAVDSITAVQSYRERIMAHIPQGRDFTPLMTLYLSENLSVETVRQAKAAGVVAIKWYPKGATTNSAQGVANVEALSPILEAMQAEGLLLLIHGEVTDADIDIFDREARFIERILMPLRTRFPALKMVMEHITTAQAVQYIQSESKNLAATITPQHLLFNRNRLLVGGIKPHYYCLPILKTETDRLALITAATSGDPRFFLGTDSAPHARHTKENACGCAGCYTAWHAPVLYAQVFDSVGKLDKLRDFACRFAADYYGLPHNSGEIILEKSPLEIPATLPYLEDSDIVPLEGGSTWQWTIKKSSQK